MINWSAARLLWVFFSVITRLYNDWFVRISSLILSRLGREGVGGGAESARADFSDRYLNNSYSYDPKISRLFLEIYC